MNKQAVVSKFSHVEPGDMEYFKTRRYKVPQPTPWK
jgi:hypothetical protein